MMESISEYLKTSEIAARVKEVYHITIPNNEMGDKEIRTVIRWIGYHVSDNKWIDGNLVLSRTAIDLMLFITLMEFPLFYMWHRLSQWN